LTIDDAEKLIFGLNKAYRNAKGGKCVFLSNDTTYRKFRAVPVDTSTDARRVFGMDHQTYQLLQYPYKVQDDVPNKKVAFANLGYYRMYRNQGFNVRIETGGRANALENKCQVIARMRFGGRLMAAAAAAVMTDADN
jgi:HK97 family phage major capsid protein